MQVTAMLVTKYFYDQARITNVNVKTRTARREIEQQQGDQRVHGGTLNIVGEFGIGDIANRFVAGIDAMRNIRDLGPIYNKGITNSDINIDNQSTPTLLRNIKMVMAMPTNITISKLLVFIFKIPPTLQITLL